MKPTPKNTSTRQSIIDAATVIFYNKGYTRTRITDILAKAHVSKSTFYRYFTSKEDICIAHLRYRNEQFSKQVGSFIGQIPAGPDRVLAMFNFLELFYQHEDFNGCWAIQILPEIPKSDNLVRSEIESQKNALIDFIEVLIRENVKISPFKDVKSIAQQFYLILESAVAQSNLHKKEWPITQAKKLCAQLLSDASKTPEEVSYKAS